MQKKKNFEAVSRFIPPLLWVLVIFFFSAQHSPYALILRETSPTAAPSVTRETPALSAAQPGKASIAQMAAAVFPRTDDKQEVLGRYLHVAEYAILSLLLVRALVWKKPLTLLMLLAVLSISLLFALSDEYHQVFVPGRRFETGDLILDVLGAGLGILFFLLLYRRKGTAAQTA